MKILHPDSTQIQTNEKTGRQAAAMVWAGRKLASVQRFFARIGMLNQRSQEFLQDIKSIGFTKTMDEYDRRKLSIFNQLNFFQLVTGIIIPLTCLFSNQKFPASTYVVASLPALVSFLVLCLNFYFKHEAGIMVYFVLYPVVTSIVYLHGMDLGVELFFILYGILSVFFLQQISQMLFSLSFSMISYFVLAVAGKGDYNQLAPPYPFFYLFNQLTAIILIFYGLFLIKKEHALYQLGILATNRNLQDKNLKIEKQKAEIEEIAELLKKQTAELTELNSIKNKLFSVIAHDLKSPMYALRNLFRNIQQYEVPAHEIKKMIPGIINDLNYSTGLMENLLHWAKSQMQNGTVNSEEVDVDEIILETSGMLCSQAQSKHITMGIDAKSANTAWANKEMIRLVLRNLVSNAIKFTPDKGMIRISSFDKADFVEVSVQDTGVGISPEALEKIQQNIYYTTQGTSSEAGTGLGLMLCREFLSRSGGQLHIASEPGKGSTFSFTLPKTSKNS
jgi:signal transduction histidine kinase